VVDVVAVEGVDDIVVVVEIFEILEGAYDTIVAV
jgi:hypothetical protein